MIFDKLIPILLLFLGTFCFAQQDTLKVRSFDDIPKSKLQKDAEGNDQINMLEINTTPGMTATSFIPQQVRAAGLDIKDVLSDIVENQF